ncbi:MAG TPA: alpha/beta fold hydrolase, partial [Rhodopila sp.]|uniref:alpha/beta fold hydrolase n=1 Tax=Rhodopila sp. TaxID=2480087 RepID=UPI002BDD1361
MTALLILLAVVAVCVTLYTPNISAALLEARYAQVPSRFLRASMQRIHYRDTGPADAPVIVMLHEICSDLHTWDGWAEALSEQYRVIRYDMPGFGLTGPDAETDYTTLRTLTVLASILDMLCVRRAILVGNALGGRIAWQFAARFPERVEKLVLVAPRHPLDVKWPLLTVWQRTLLPVVLPAWFVRRTLREAWGDPRRLTDATVARYHDLLRRPGVRRGLSARSILLVMNLRE